MLFGIFSPVLLRMTWNCKSFLGLNSLGRDTRDEEREKIMFV